MSSGMLATFDYGRMGVSGLRTRLCARFAAMAIGLTVVGLAVGGFGLHQSSVQKVTGDSGSSYTPGNISSLSAIETVIQVTFADIAHLSTDALLRMKDRGDSVVLLDAREADEFKVSRIPGAVRVDPDATPHQLLRTTGHLKGKTVVVYCSIGARSSSLVRRVRARLQQSGVRSLYNLSGGIFRWHNEQRQLIDDAGATDYVHKFDGYWGQLVRRQELAVSAPLRTED